jgi:hypothetical protein
MVFQRLPQLAGPFDVDVGLLEIFIFLAGKHQGNPAAGLCPQSEGKLRHDGNENDLKLRIHSEVRFLKGPARHEATIWHTEGSANMHKGRGEAAVSSIIAGLEPSRQSAEPWRMRNCLCLARRVGCWAWERSSARRKGSRHDVPDVTDCSLVLA